MTIRPEQWGALRAVSEDGFAAKAVARLRALFPKHAAMMGEAAICELARRGIPRARGFGFQSERGIQTYLSLMVYFGSECHRDPQYPWLRALLEEKTGKDEKDRINRIIHATGEYAVLVAGPNREHVDKALATLASDGRALISNPPRPVTAEAVERILTQVYATKAGQLGHEGMMGLMQHAYATARLHELHGAEPVILFSLLQLMLGTFAGEDPQFGWINRTTEAHRGEPEARRYAHLVDTCFERLSAWTAAMR
ncbi:MAG: hypothetical protein IT162_01090 [Bryobacterales bacterium]|nr:hypothetical protein [Bryobacterales bacterium]